jgi:hypothetical protein
MLPAGVGSSRGSLPGRSRFRTCDVLPISERMNTMACRAVARAGMSAATASLDDEAAWPLLLVAGWLTTAADLVLEAGLLASLAEVPAPDRADLTARP